MGSIQKAILIFFLTNKGKQYFPCDLKNSLKMNVEKPPETEKQNVG